jgi:ribosomal protein S18 acetylase RimI-like enzyme
VTIVYRPMRKGEAAEVALMVRAIAEHVGSTTVPKLDGESLFEAADLIDTVVAEDGGRLLGACLGLMTFSTWRGCRGLYVVDLFVAPEARGRQVGRDLLRFQARRFAERGARFIKLEVDESNAGAEAFYARLGFAKKAEDRLHVLEQNEFNNFVAMGENTT